jgi:hypothetical protein
MFRSERLDFTRPALRSAAEGRRLVRLCAARATLNYFGQGGLLLTDPGAVESPFYQLGKQIVLRDRCDLGRRQARQKTVRSRLERIRRDRAVDGAWRGAADFSFSRAIMCFTSGQQDGDKAHRRMVGILSLGDVSNSAPGDLLSECVKSVSAHH